MKRMLLALFLSLVCLNCGCSLRDCMFSALSDSYSGGGATFDDKKRHFDQEVSRWEGGPQYYDPIHDR